MSGNFEHMLENFQNSKNFRHLSQNFQYVDEIFFNKEKYNFFIICHTKNSELLRFFLHVSGNFSLYTKILSYDTKDCRIAKKITDSNATLLPGFFSRNGLPDLPEQYWSSWEGCLIFLSRIDDPAWANQAIRQTTKIWGEKFRLKWCSLLIGQAVS